MIIENVAVSFPTRKVGNDEVVDMVRTLSKNFEGDLSKMLRVVKTRLDRSGLVNRNWRERNELPIDHVLLSVDSALNGTGLRPQDIDLLIYVGIGGGFHKLGNAYILAKTLGIHNAECFDILDACMSWTRALSLANSLFKTRNLRNALIVNAEFNVIENAEGVLETGRVRHLQELDYLLPSYTIGEAATATLLLPTAPDNFSITFHSKPDFAHLCMIPAAGYEGFFEVDHATAEYGVGRFTAFGREIHDRIAEELPLTMVKSQIRPSEADIVFTHASSKAAWDRIGQQHGFADKIFHIYPETGNVVSASIPAAMAMAQDAGRLLKKARVAFLMGSAGMSFSTGGFLY